MAGQFWIYSGLLNRDPAGESLIMSCSCTSVKGHQPRCLSYQWCRRTTVTCWLNLTALTRFCLRSDWTLADLRYSHPSHVYTSINVSQGQFGAVETKKPSSFIFQTWTQILRYGTRTLQKALPRRWTKSGSVLTLNCSRSTLESKI